MTKVKGLTNRIAAVFLSGLLVIGAVPGTVLASESPEDLGQTAETAAEDLGQTSEVSAKDMGDTLSEGVSTEGLSEDAALQEEEAAVQYYTVTLDANGGYFENEWDDAKGEIVEQAQIVNKQVPVGGTVAAAPVFTETDQDGQAVTFAGWSLEPDGELVTAGDEEYAPADSCTLYAVWEAEDPSAGAIASELESQEIAEENTDQTDAAQDFWEEAAEGSQGVQGSVEADEAEESATGRDAWNNGTAEESSADENPASEADTDPEPIDENEQAAASDQEADYADEEAEKATGESSDAAISVEETQAELNESSREEETVREDAANGVVESGTCGDNLTWTLDEEGTLTISGSGSIKKSAFESDDRIKKVIINNSCTSIGNSAFYDCEKLTSITIPDSVTSIGQNAFNGCSSLTSITIPDSVTSLGHSVLSGCSSLTDVRISKNITSISNDMFFGCISLTSIDIPDNITRIGDYSFNMCSSLKSIMIPKNVTSIGICAFRDSFNLKKILVEEGNQNYSSIDGVLFNSDQTVLVCYPCGGESVYSIPETVTSIDDYAFVGCSNLTGITIPDSVTSIGQDSFKDCRKLVIYGYSGSKAQEYAGENNIPFKILINRASVTIPDQSYTYTGDHLEPEVTVILNETQLTEDTDYEVTYGNNIDVGVEPATVTVTGTGDYAGKKELTFTIVQALQPITASDLTLPYPESGKIMVSGNQGQLSYTSSDLSVAEVDDSGNVTAKKKGTATIKITAAETKNYKKTEKEITVTVVKGTQAITASDLSLTYPETGFINVSGNVGDLTYESANEKVATVDTDGKVTAAGAGDTVILITALETDNYNKATKEITVNVAKAAQPITASDLFLTYPETGLINVSGNAGDLTYESANEKVATVDTDGKVTAAGAGATKILITAEETGNYKKTTKEIRVNVAKAAQSIAATDLSLTYPNSGKITVSGNAGDLTFESADEKVATVDTAGKVTATGAGDTRILITALETDNYKKATKEITVNVAKAAQPITASDLLLTYPNSGKITVSGNEGDLTYESADEKVATVDTEGKVTAKGAGDTKITITAKETDNYKKATKEIMVSVARVAQTITASGLSLTYPNSGKITVSGNEGSLTYKSSNTAVATVDSAGKVTAKGGGTAKITITAAATSNYNAAAKTITVKVAKAAQSITAKSAASSVFVGKTTTVSVTGAKGTTSFKSSDTTIATVSSEGKVTGRKGGTVRITATSAATAQYNATSMTVTIKVIPIVTPSLTAANQAAGIKLTWKKAVGAAGYKIYRNSTLIKTITGDSTVTYVDTKANTNMTRYIYKVAVKGPDGDSPLARSVTAYRVDRPVLSSVTNSAASVITAKWTAIPRVNGYQIKYSTSKTFASGNGTVSANNWTTNTKLIGKLTKGKTWYVKIRAYKLVGNGVYWSEWSPVRTVRISK